MLEKSCKGLRDDTVCILIGGEAGQGITRSGGILSRALMRIGLHVFGTNEYPSLIRGGHNYYLLRASMRPVHAQSEYLDILIALNRETALLHEAELNSGGDILIDESIEFEEGELRKDINLHKVPMASIVKELGGTEIMRNTVALGAAVGLLNLDPDVLRDVVADTFPRPEVVEMNMKAIDKGYEHVKGWQRRFNCDISGSIGNKRILLTGNEAIALGAVSAGLRFYAAYPMTPASPILDWMMAHGAEAGLVVIQAESARAWCLNLTLMFTLGGMEPSLVL